jgi:branched-chain amino acid transport system substrate-binding protein
MLLPWLTLLSLRAPVELLLGIVPMSPVKLSICLGLCLSAVSCYADPSPSLAEGGSLGSGSQAVRIGFVTSLTGVAAEPSKDMVNGIKLYLDQIGYKMAGRKVELVVENDECNPATAKVKVRKLAEEDHVDVIDGFLLTNIGYAVAPMADELRVPLVLCVSSGDDLTQRQHYEYVVRTSNTNSGSTMPFGEWVYRKLGYKRIATFGMDYPYGWETVGGFQKTFELAGGRVVQKIWAPLGFVDFSHYINQLHKDIDAVFVVNSGKAADVFPKQYHDAGMKFPIIAGGSSYEEDVLRHLGDESVGAISVQNYSAMLNTPANKSFVGAYAEKYGVPPGRHAESAYASGMFIKAAVEALKGDVSDKRKFMDALRKVSITTPAGPIKLDDHGQAIENYYVMKVEKVNGKLQNSVVATFPKVSQFWKFNPKEYLQLPAYSQDYPPCRFCSETK